MTKDKYEDKASKEHKNVTSYLKKMRRYQHRIGETNEAMGELSQQLTILRDEYTKKEISPEDFIKELRPYRKQLKNLEKSAKAEKKTVEKERQTIDELLEKIAAVVLLSIATFSLITSIVDNPSITGYSVLGISSATNTTFILNVIAFIFVVLLVYPSGEIIEQFKPLRTKSRTKTRRKRRK
jgi:SMC interacting uncharacterized protein involved in chromosome segregation